MQCDVKYKRRKEKGSSILYPRRTRDSVGCDREKDDGTGDTSSCFGTDEVLRRGVSPFCRLKPQSTNPNLRVTTGLVRVTHWNPFSEGVRDPRVSSIELSSKERPTYLSETHLPI